MITDILQERQRHAEIIIQQILKAKTLEDLERLKDIARFYLTEDLRIKEVMKEMGMVT